MLTTAVQTLYDRFEYTLAFHCAPSMAGIKAADLISWPGEPEDTLKLLGDFNRSMAPTGIKLRRMCFCRGRSLILVYRESRLVEYLSRNEVSVLLEQEGYPVEDGLEAMLDHLAQQMLDVPGFPHEVGLFLGYPVEDVEGFRKNDGRNFKFSGLWKVYSDEERARECFHRYHCCRQALCRRVESGCPLCQVFRAA